MPLFKVEILAQNKTGYVISLYRSPSQTQGEFNNFLLNFEQHLSDIISWNTSFLSIKGDFNVRTSSWWRKNATTLEGIEAEAITCLG